MTEEIKPIKLSGQFTELFPKEFGPAEPVPVSNYSLAGFTKVEFTLTSRNGDPVPYHFLEGAVIAASEQKQFVNEEIRLIWVRFQLTHLWAGALYSARIFRANGALEKAGKMENLADQIQYELEISRDMDGI